MFDRLDWLRTWALVADPLAWFLILLLAAATLGRSGAFRSRWFDLLKPWKRTPSPGRPAAPEPGPTHPLRDPWFLFLLGISAAAVASWIVMRMTATGGKRP
jgi:hypothetical protein